MPLSRSGRTLSEILTLSYKNLKTYTIDKVRHGAWGKPTNVTYHSQAQTLEDFQREMESMKIQFQREMESVKIQLDSLQAEREGQREVMKKWQAVNNIFQALCEIAWEQISAKRKEDLATEDIYDFADLYYNYRSSEMTRSVYVTVSSHICEDINATIKLKKELKKDRGYVAHPDISAAYLQEVLKELGIEDTIRDQLISLIS
ncbi:hypothetical protein BDR04DRAFT_1140433 [Suillus decipiens]|nr:hypothetical protein BDR04DRAFT_1140433 [Suillus decipiens]